jgi:hypothetical protein
MLWNVLEDQVDRVDQVLPQSRYSAVFRSILYSIMYLILLTQQEATLHLYKGAPSGSLNATFLHHLQRLKSKGQ